MGGTAVIVVAAGSGKRFGSEMPKQYLMLNDAPVIRHCVQAFNDHPGIDFVQPVIRVSDHEDLMNALSGLAYLPSVEGGEERQDSVRNGLAALVDLEPDNVLIHDGARPFVDPGMIDRVLEALESSSAVIPAIPVVDTLKRTDSDLAVIDTVSRTNLWRAQTPQGFGYVDLSVAHVQAVGQALTDDAAVMEAAGHTVHIVQGDENNIKVTSPEDLARLEAIMEPTNLPPTASVRPQFRVGSGYDVHRSEPGTEIILGGVTLPSDVSLMGHSDADVALHAITDAILGAIANGDIGSHFPPSDERWRGASSDQFLAHACALMTEAGFGLSNIDLTIICEKPKIGPHRDAIRASIAEIAGIEVDMISVKATTTERLGFTGRGEGIAADATVLVQRLDE